MTFPISNTHLEPALLVVIGFTVGVLGGFFGVGGSFLAGPALFAMGLPMNFVVGTDLSHILGKSIVAARRHRALGHVDLKLGVLMAVGTIVGVEAGAQAIERLKTKLSVDLYVGIAFTIVLLGISGIMAWEAIATSRAQKPKTKNKNTTKKPQDHSAFGHVPRWLKTLNWPPPFVDFPVSGIQRLSIWAVLMVSFTGGLFSGFLGGGAGYIRMPAMVYLLGVPTHIAVGTDLFEIVISATYGTVTHALKGNVDILIALVMHTGAAVGAQLGAVGTTFFSGPRLRAAFVPLPLIGAVLVIYGLLNGHHFK